MVKLGQGGNYLKTDDCKDGEVIKFIDAGTWEENTRYKYADGNPKFDFICQIEINGEQKRFRVNKTNRDILIEFWGNDTEAWVTKLAKIKLEDAYVGGIKRKMIILNPQKSSSESTDDSVAWDE